MLVGERKTSRRVGDIILERGEGCTEKERARTREREGGRLKRKLEKYRESKREICEKERGLYIESVHEREG